MRSYTLGDLHELRDQLFGRVGRWIEWADWAWGVLRGAGLTRASTATEYTRVLGRLLVLRVMLDQCPVFPSWLEQPDPSATDSRVMQEITWSVIKHEWPVVVRTLRAQVEDDLLLNTLLFHSSTPQYGIFDDGEVDYGPHAEYSLTRLIDLEYGISTEAIRLAYGKGFKGYKWVQDGMPLNSEVRRAE